MKLSDLHIHHLRNIHNRRFQLDSRLNYVVGPNGSGKTSFLEALYLVATGRSFRTREVSQLISQGETKVQIFAQTFDEQRLSIQKSLNEPMLAQINAEPCMSSSALARLLPCQLLYQDIFHIIDAGAAVRRAVLDWGLFHVEQSYHLLLKEYRRVLQQRNTLLRQHAPFAHFEPWNHQLSRLAEQIDAKRISYFNNLYPCFLETLNRLTDLECRVHYFKGWDKKNEGKHLAQILEQCHSSDQQRQFTHYGAHQADLIIEVEDKKAKHFLSRGQQKICLFALKIAQVVHMKKNTMVLIDDFMSELDSYHIQKLLDYIYSLENQFFITCQPEAAAALKAAKVINMELQSKKVN